MFYKIMSKSYILIFKRTYTYMLLYVWKKMERICMRSMSDFGRDGQLESYK